MAMPYETTGRTRQKSRTRQALIDATRELLAGGQTPRVEDAAAHSGISRTTAYRYFANQRALLLATQPEIHPDTLLGPEAPTDPRDRLDAFMAAFSQYNLQWQPQLRSALRLSLEPTFRGASHEPSTAPSPPSQPAPPAHDAAATEPGRPLLRQGRAVAWIEDALAPLEHSHPRVDRHRLAIAIRSATGIESLIWLQDVAGQSPAEAAETVRHTARALLDAALRQSLDHADPTPEAADAAGKGAPSSRSR
ncbi:TetR/AcrR family transcriptional regulator [Actinoplanes oblitus]|uniref:TetR/AcrR family transcriptional regulator n=1 Tax=Actinoplanes oblitus TaxID=3040509 RepID=A0ABY8W6J8_9ACTN|nr:TetR/AcrR family transcriptional regulator [Actinoplanes oblitus]WIM93293.1 TetR/AcrR family transcriptional regulator [Actinoplanes oblitus]